jgi:hypothetical protein
MVGRYGMGKNGLMLLGNEWAASKQIRHEIEAEASGIIEVSFFFFFFFFHLIDETNLLIKHFFFIFIRLNDSSHWI